MKRLVFVLALLMSVVVLATSASDNFTYSNGALPTVSSGAWETITSSTALQVESNTVHASPIAEFQSARWASGTWASDGYSQATKLDSGGAFVGVCVRMSSTGGGAGYCFIVYDVSTGNTGIWELEGGSFNQLEVGYTVPDDGSVIKIEASGSTLTAYDDGVALGDVSDGTTTSGNPGIVLRDQAGINEGALDAWSAADAGGAAAPCLRALLGVGCHASNADLVRLLIR